MSEAVFTKSICIILKSNSLRRLLVWCLVCFGPLWPYLARFGVVTPRHILPMHLHRSWVCPVQQESPPTSKKFLGGVKVIASKSDFLPPPCELLLWEPICHMEKRRHLHTHGPMHVHTMSCWGRGNGWLSPVWASVCMQWSNARA